MGIYVNQVGYQPDRKKVAIATAEGRYCVVRKADDAVVLEKDAVFFGEDDASLDTVWKVDFSELKEEGTYLLRSASGEVSDSFVVGKDVYKPLQAALAKALYFQRCGVALTEEYAGVYTHAACHTEPAIMYEDYINHTENPKTYDLQGGWHDAGDFGRYSTAAAVAVAHMLYAYELFPSAFTETVNIPESGNHMPDILNECLYELRWLIKMQAEDGGVYHKLTAYRHAPFIMPQDDHDPFLIYPVSSMAVADYAAVMAIASRVYAPFEPEFAKEALLAARKSFDWLTKNPYVGFRNPEGSGTGEYDDATDEDERFWAAAEMLRTDKEGDAAAYRSMFEKYLYSDIGKTDFGWTDVAGFAALCMLTDPGAEESYRKVLSKAVLDEADRLHSVIEASGYDVAMKPFDYVWGSNMTVCNRGMLFILAAMTSKENADRYTEDACNMLHYLLGRNALNRSYVTGFGEHAYHNPHNRPTACDGIDDPMPGWVSGGPFKTPCDEDAKKLIPVGTPPMKCHADVIGSYSTNEITIYWNSPAIFMTAALNCRW